MEHDHVTKRIGWTILLNIVITAVEYVGGVMSGSLALLSDAGHNFSDVLSLLLGYFGERASEKGATKNHSFGFRRSEVFTALINAIALWAVGIFIIIGAFERFGEPNTISLGLMIAVAFVGLAGNALSILVLNKDKDHSINMRAAYAHLFYDTISSVAVIVSGVVIYFTNFVLLDIIVSIFIALMVFFSGFEIIKKAVHILMQGVPEGIEFDEVYSSIKKVNGVLDVHSLHIWSIDSNNIFLSCHVCVDEKESTDRTITAINDMLKKSYNVAHTTIQAERENLCDNGAICCK